VTDGQSPLVSHESNIFFSLQFLHGPKAFLSSQSSLPPEEKNVHRGRGGGGGRGEAA